MIAICKGVEPEGLAELRAESIRDGDTPDQAYKRLRNPLKKDVRNSLIREQGRLCAYCMSRIPPLNRENVEELYIHIEHIIPRNPEDHRNVGQGLDYSNMVATCRGYRDDDESRHSTEFLTCDAHKGNKEFRKINPLQSNTLSSIYYTVDGVITSDDADVRYDLNDILNLNCPSSPLKAERKAALEELLEQMALTEETSLLNICHLYLEMFQAETEVKTPYVGILLWYLQDMIASLEEHL